MVVVAQAPQPGTMCASLARNLCTYMVSFAVWRCAVIGCCQQRLRPFLEPEAFGTLNTYQVCVSHPVNNFP